MRQTAHKTIIAALQRVRPTMVLGLALAVGSVSSAVASEKARIKSRFTTVELKSCAAVQPDSDPGPASSPTSARAWTCDGLSGYPVYVAEGDRHQFISFGPNANRRRAATQTLKSANSVFTPDHSRATVEWRFRRRDGRDVPYATIMRFYTSSGSKGDVIRGDVLVVSKVTPTDACQVARIDALANPDAIIIARSVADELSPTFDCRTDQLRVIGATGRSPM